MLRLGSFCEGSGCYWVTSNKIWKLVLTGTWFAGAVILKTLVAVLWRQQEPEGSMFLWSLTRDSQGKMVALQYVLRPAKPQELWLLLQCKPYLLDWDKSGSCCGIAESNYCSVCLLP